MNKIFARFNDRESTGSLSQLCTELIAGQQRSWPELRQAYESLQKMQVREVRCEGYTVLLQHNPGRTINTLAPVDRADIEGRPCFLCAGNLPEEQNGILYDDGYVILCNPRPVFHSHLTISSIEHVPQAIAGKLDVFLGIAADLGPGWALLYNGPGCGASAPDHMHFQAILSGNLPVEKEMTDPAQFAAVEDIGGVIVSRARGAAREIVIMEGNSTAALERVFGMFCRALEEALLIDEEPMMNIACFYDQGRWRLVVFPRAKHRPDAFFREDVDRVVVSPAIVEMGGVIITPMKKDFERLDAFLIEGIFREVSLGAAVVDKALRALRS